MIGIGVLIIVYLFVTGMAAIAKVGAWQDNGRNGE